MLNYLTASYQVMKGWRLSGEALKNHVSRKLKSVLKSAGCHVPYYRGMMREIGYDPEKDYTGPKDLKQFPVTKKLTLKSIDETEFIHERADLSVCHKNTTSGSTGIPLTVYRSRSEAALYFAKWLRVLFVNGYHPHEKVMSITSPKRLQDGRSLIQHFGLFRRKPINYFISPDKMVDIMISYQPQVLYGNRSHLDLIANVLKERAVRPVGLKLLISVAEVLREKSKTLYNENFGVEVTETYGSIEMGTLAHETLERDGLRLCEDLTYFEFLDDNDHPVPPGVPGRVVVTDLTNIVMPLIRYDQGDCVVYEVIRDKNGNPVRRIKQILGREDDYAILPDGSRLSFHYFYEVFDRFPNIDMFRIVQQKKYLFDIFVVTDSEYFEKVEKDILSQLKKGLVPSIQFRILRVEKIQPDESGKVRMLISKVGKI